MNVATITHAAAAQPVSKAAASTGFARDLHAMLGQVGATLLPPAAAGALHPAHGPVTDDPAGPATTLRHARQAYARLA